MSKETIVDVFWERVKKHPEKAAILHKKDGSFRPVIWREHGRVVELAAGGLLKLGVERNQKVAIMSQTRPEWTWADLAILSIAGTTVPVYPTLASPEARYIMDHSDAVGVFVENAGQLTKVLSIPVLPPKLRFVIQMEGAIQASDSRLRILSWDDLLKDGEVHLPGHPNDLPDRISSVQPTDLATIVYTSGTTGIPKGAMLLHSTIHSVCKSILETSEFFESDLALSFLPLAHVYERVGGQFFSIFAGFTVAYAESMERVPQNMQEVKPTILNGVPRFFEKAYQRIQAEIRKMPKAQQYLIRWALALGRRASKYEQANDTEQIVAKTIYKTELRVADRIVFSKIRNRFGGRLRVMVSGAAPLAEEVQSFFETIGLTIVEGYGLTETAAPAVANTLKDRKIGTVGKPLPGVQLKLAEDGEILLKGASIFNGYYKNEQASKDAFTEDGWFMTGDIGELDSNGYLRILDRKKDIIITAGGKHIAPQRIENLFRGDPLISQILVYGDRRKFISALITLNEENVKAFATANNIQYKNYDELINHPLVVKSVETAVNERNEALSNYEKVKKWKILDKDFSIEGDELTPTLKIKRKMVTERYKSVLDGFYDAEDLALEGASSKVN